MSLIFPLFFPLSPSLSLCLCLPFSLSLSLCLSLFHSLFRALKLSVYLVLRFTDPTKHTQMYSHRGANRCEGIDMSFWPKPLDTADSTPACKITARVLQRYLYEDSSGIFSGGLQKWFLCACTKMISAVKEKKIFLFLNCDWMLRK